MYLSTSCRSSSVLLIVSLKTNNTCTLFLWINSGSKLHIITAVFAKQSYQFVTKCKEVLPSICCNFKPTSLQSQAYKVLKNLCHTSELGLSEMQLYFSHCRGKTPICKLIFLLLLHLVRGIREYLQASLGHFPKSNSFSITLKSTLSRAALFDHVIVGTRHSLKESEFFYLSLNTFSANFNNYLKLSSVKNVKKIKQPENTAQQLVLWTFRTLGCHQFDNLDPIHANVSHIICCGISRFGLLSLIWKGEEKGVCLCHMAASRQMSQPKTIKVISCRAALSHSVGKH